MKNKFLNFLGNFLEQYYEKRAYKQHMSDSLKFKKNAVKTEKCEHIQCSCGFHEINAGVYYNFHDWHCDKRRFLIIERFKNILTKSKSCDILSQE